MVYVSVEQRLLSWISADATYQWYTTREIADLIHCSKSPTLVGLLRSCTAKGFLEVQTSPIGDDRHATLWRVISHRQMVLPGFREV